MSHPASRLFGAFFYVVCTELMAGVRSEIYKNTHSSFSGLHLYEFLDVFPSSATHRNLARARVTTIWDQVATGSANENETKTQTQDQHGLCLRRR